jgi:hypothetical protein
MMVPRCFFLAWVWKCTWRGTGNALFALVPGALNMDWFNSPGFRAMCKGVTSTCAATSKTADSHPVLHPPPSG